MSVPDISDVIIPPAPLPHVIVPFPMYITVHLGAPDENAINVTVPYIDYIKNVASSELYPTWPEEALRANIHAITSVALNRIFTEWYRSRGYDFDITNSTQYDQAYVHERGIFDTISTITNEIFDQYIVREGHVEPMFAAFCDGRISQCDGMYQWGSVDLANQGYTALEILRYYYGDDVYIVTAEEADEVIGTYPGRPLSIGDSGIDVFRMQHSLRRISRNFPLIPRLEVTGFFDLTTEIAVEIFQEVFDLPITGVVDEDTWYRIRTIYVAVTNLAELISEGLTREELEELFRDIILEGGSRPIVPYIQFFLNVVSQKYPSIEPVEISRVYGPETTAAITEFQNIMGLRPTGITDLETLRFLYSEAYSILTSTPVEELRLTALLPFMGVNLVEGMGAEYIRVLLLEIMLNYISNFIPGIPKVEVGSDFGPDTTTAVIMFQRLYDLDHTGIVDEETWNMIITVYQQLWDEQEEENTE
ncbi:MAG: spore cortex-lytic protein [Tissierellia bacterium]|nr:spore cortex-lytic protein [Tissierellia bacterium]